jgi:hypothetical protein
LTVPNPLDPAVTVAKPTSNWVFLKVLQSAGEKSFFVTMLLDDAGEGREGFIFWR